MTTTITAQEKETPSLQGPTMSFTPGGAVPPGRRDATALVLFQSFLCNPSEDRSTLSNVISLWEQIPRYTGDRLNRQDNLPNELITDFEVSGQPFQLSITPGTYRARHKGVHRAVRRFPGIREQAVEQALIQVATDQAQCAEENGKTQYYVYFSLRQLAERLKMMGSSMSHAQIREALEVLNSAMMGLTVSDAKAKMTERTPIIPLFRQRTSDQDEANGTDAWVVSLHPIINHAIRNVTYRQFPIRELKNYRPFGAHLVRRMFWQCPNISPTHPFTFSMEALAKETPGLDHTRLSSKLKALEGELEKMLKDGLITHYDVDVQYAKTGNGRPAMVDAIMTLYPGERWVKAVKSASKRLTLSEQSLGLPRSQRTMRQQSLPLG